MELRCPACISPEVKPDPQGKDEARRCANCGARFPRERAFVTVLEAEADRGEVPPPQLFAFDPARAAAELRKCDGAITAISPHSDADELNALLESAQTARIILARRERTWMYVYPLSIREPDPLLAVDLGRGPTLLGFELELRQGEGEDPIAFTVRFLEEAVKEANGFAAGLAADSDRLDRIAAFMNRPGEWSGGDVCEFVAKELDEGGRRILDS